VRLSAICAYLGGILTGIGVARHNEWLFVASLIVMFVGGARSAYEEEGK